MRGKWLGSEFLRDSIVPPPTEEMRIETRDGRPVPVTRPERIAITPELAATSPHIVVTVGVFGIRYELEGWTESGDMVLRRRRSMAEQIAKALEDDGDADAYVSETELRSAADTLQEAE